MPGEVLEGSSLEEEQESANGHNHSPDLLPLPQEEPEPEQGDSEPNVMEPMSDRRGNCKNFLFIPDVLIHFQTGKDQFAVFGGMLLKTSVFLGPLSPAVNTRNLSESPHLPGGEHNLEHY